MNQLTLNKCLNKLDTIIFRDYENNDQNNDDVYEIGQILGDVRKYIIVSTLVHNKRSFMVLLEFINYLIQESYHTMTNQFINHVIGLRQLIIKYEGGYLQIEDEKIDFDEECNTFLKKYVI